MENIAYVGIDASLSSTAVCIEINGTDKYLCYHKVEKLSKWHRVLTDIVYYERAKFTYHTDYSDSELYKIVEYNVIAASAIDRIAKECNGCNNIVVGLEGYSYSSSSGHLIDLVTIGSAIRYRLLKVTPQISIYPPSTLKLEAAKMTYPVCIEKKKEVYRNNQLIPGGSFKKPHMVRAMFEQNKSHSLKTILLPYRSELLAAANIPKPIDDLDDAYWLKELAKKQHI